MSGSMTMSAAPESAAPMAFDDVSFHLEDLAGKLRVSMQKQTNAKHWELMNRVIAYAASAEQHISEQQARIRELEALSSTDELTGLANRRGLADFMHRLLSVARRHNEQGILAFLDLNNFKEINDLYGHDVGDLALKHFATTIRENLRESDFVARLGGDEFVFVLTRTNEVNGEKRARAIQALISKTYISARGQKLPLQASMGVIAFDGDSSYRDLMRDADVAMYKEKKACKARDAAMKAEAD
ncbi:MAG: GGDEF domain-containing protein [Alphaproteobacteria bacterium]|nr:MAG: GGDEF domain-containing protein [Alphaproteobacteria bacterium]